MADLYPIDKPPQAPRLPGTVVLRPDADRLIDALAADLLIHAHNCVRGFGDFHLALSGGSTPVALYQRLMIDPRYRDLPWARTHLWIVDERRVGFDDERSNYKMISEIIGDHSGIPPEQVHPIFAQADDADAQYERTLRETLGWRERGHDRLDFVLLGMGADAHTASLFPRSPALDESLAPGSRALVRVNAGPTVTPPDRVTMTLPLINASRFIALLVTGAGKRATVERVAAGGQTADPATVRELPVLGVRPIGGELRWYLDHDACPGAPAEPA
jgi:6-phosphogluconolactonase